MSSDTQTSFHVRVTDLSTGGINTLVLRLPAGSSTIDAINSVMEAYANPKLKIEAVLLGTGAPTHRVLGSGRAFHTAAQAESYARGLSLGYAAGRPPLGDFQDLGAADAERRAEQLAEWRAAQREAAWGR